MHLHQQQDQQQQHPLRHQQYQHDQHSHSTSQQPNSNSSTSAPSSQPESAPSVRSDAATAAAEDDINFHDFIHAKHDDERYMDEGRSSMVLPGSDRGPSTNTTTTATTQGSVQSQSTQISNHTQPIGGNLHITSHSLDRLGNDASAQQEHLNNNNTTNDTHVQNIYSHSSDHFPPYDLIPPPTQDLFRTVMEELQAEAAHQKRDHLLAASTSTSTRPDSGVEVDYSLGGHHHHSRTLPRFMMEPLDFLSGDYESCLGHSTDIHSTTDTTSSDFSSFSGQFGSSTHDHSQNTVASSLQVTYDSHSPSHVRSGSMDSINSRKRPLDDDDSHILDQHNNSTTTPPSFSTSHNQQSPPTQDLFRMLMEELETHAALQARQEAAGATVNNTDYAFNSNGQHHARLPRFVMEPLDFFNTDYGTMHVDGSISEHSGVSGGASSTSASQMHSATSPSLESSHSHLQQPQQQQQQQQEFTPPVVFRTLMEELEVQAAFQRQALAATTGTAPRIDPEEYVFNGQHLRPLPRFMIEPLDFMPSGYESYLNSGMSSGIHHFDPSQNNFLSLSHSQSSAASSSSAPMEQNNQNFAPPAKRATRRPSASGSGVKGAKSRRPKHLTIAPRSGSNLEVPTSGSNQLPSPSKKRRVGDDDDIASGSCSPSNLATSPFGSSTGDGQDSPISPTSMSNLSISSDAQSPDGSATDGAAAQASKRPWTHKDETLLLKLFAKRLPIKEIAQTLDRSVHSVRSRRQILTDPGFVKGKGHSVSRRCKQDPATTTKLPTYAQMAFLSLAWLPDLEGTLNDVATMVEKLFSKHLNRIPRTGHKNLQIWRAQISDALAHEKGQPRPRFESFGVKRGRQWVYRLTEFGKGVVEAMGGVDTICEDLLKSNEMEMASAQTDDVDGSQDGSKDADGVGIGGSGADAGIGQGQGYGYSYKPPDTRQKSNKGSSRAARRSLAKKKAAAAAAAAAAGEPLPEGGGNAIENAVEAIAAAMAKMMASEEKKDRKSESDEDEKDGMMDVEMEADD
ncbi:hypothetical protein BGZ97_000649 [Linnemannia gamsii]|jgi:DNA-binding Lrp family transcriptional regulator|uniref:Uncharacterized protein n=1 Tax=Linnemannia gamsii TaxID=64522 RepID=A0A9P6QZD5_9FUNG|nr:hypothetical protein BGZ97_000649 [Linnemannia gamsii]